MARANPAYISLTNGALLLHPDISQDEHRRYDLTPEGGAQFVKDIKDLEINTIAASSTIDFCEEYGVNNEFLAEHFHIDRSKGRD